MKKVNWGVLGFGQASNSFIKSIINTKNADLYAISSVSKYQNLINNKQSLNFNKVKFYNNYFDLLKDQNVDAVYIGLTNNLHSQWIINCLKYDKNILCEKPSAVNSKEFINCYNLIKNKKILFTEALMYRHHPQTLELIKLIRSKIIGDVLEIKSYCGFDIGKKFLNFELKSLNYNSRLLNKNLGGGAILDLGCYPLTMSMLVSGLTENKNYLIPRILKKNTKIGISKVDEHATIELAFSNNIKAYCEVAIRKKLKNEVIIKGTKGEIIVKSPWLPGKSFFFEFTSIKNSEKEVLQFNCDKEIFVYLIENMSESILLKKELNYPSVTNLEILEYLKIIDYWKNF
jgi:predicted dehydrogenase